MDLELLNRTARKFLYPNKRERFLFDMTRECKDWFGGLPRSQMEAVCRLPRIIDSSLMIMESYHFPPPDRLISLMAQNGVGDTCFVLSEFEDLIGVIAPLAEVADRLHTNGFPSLMVGLPSGFAHLKHDSWASGQPNCFVRPKIRFDGKPWTD